MTTAPACAGVNPTDSGPCSLRVADAAGQKQFGFDRDETDVDLPRCEMTGVSSDVHLVVYGDGSGTVAKLLGPEPRFVQQQLSEATPLS